MHIYTDSKKQAIVDRAQAAIELAQSIIDDMRSKRAPVKPNDYVPCKVRISDMTPEEQSKIIRMENKPR